MANQVATITAELVDGTKVVVPDSLDHITSYVLQEQNDWFEDEIKFLRGVVQPGTTVVDIGANYGVYALSLARKVGSTGHVWAFEPATDTAELLRASASVNATDWLMVVQQALSDRQGTAWLQMPGQSELNSLANSDGAATEVGPGEAVTITTLDACLELFGWSKVDLLKIDAEGEEDRILLGGARFFRDLSPLVMFEVKAGMDLHLDLVDRFQELGYQCFHLIPGLDVLAPFDAGQGVDGYLLNLFAAKPDRCQALAAAGKLVGYTDMVKVDVGQAHSQLDSWLADLEKNPYAQSLAPRWLSKANQPQREAICQALASWSISQDCSQPITKRFGALCFSYDLLNQECQLGCPVSRWASLTRVALALGERQRAIEAVSAMLADLQSGEEPRMDEPFLCPDPAFDAVDPAGQLKAWLEAAGLSVLEQFGCFSGFFSAESALPRLERLISLGFANETTQRRRKLLTKRFGTADQDASDSQPAQLSPQFGSGSDLQDALGTSARAWFHFLRLQKPLRCIDVGALALKGDPDPWIHWAQIGCAEVLGFEPLKDECAKLNDQAEANGIAMRYLPWALGDGNEHTLNITNEPMTSSLFKPARSTIDLFPALGDLMHVVAEETVQTRRLDDIREAAPTDFLRLDVQGAELMILESAKAVLRHVSVIQCEVEFIELYLGQPLMADGHLE
ncbi:FkbM family methyltransferase [Cyanobium sp. Cruz-8D1]|uniref:FkbM family methyltransferase n=1 Tax=Cyanobium sp. Cruz-8D1 TaxID=2823711 RepID=UPI0020CCD2C8|nr:FkbM family methyltransferase [Cyanobium sp. Cruz-8D1]MCP9868714.1 FkbM family methyltransferase [Cyanobium sp. Cruz-8D1]